MGVPNPPTGASPGGAAGDRAPGDRGAAPPAATPRAAAPRAVAGEALVRLAGLTVGYHGRDVLCDVSLEIAVGERLAVVGPNGAGKSTLLRAITGIVRPRLGEAFLGPDRLAFLDRRAVARRVAVVPGSATIPFSTRVEDVVALGRMPYLDPLHGPRAVDRAAVDAAIDRVGIGDLRDRDARELSLGERQLVLVAMAVAQRAPLLILDEPTVHLDLRHQLAVMELLVDLNERGGTTILAVLHDLALARHFFPRMIVLDHGTVAADGDPRDLLAGPLVRSVFGVDPALLSSLLGDIARAQSPSA